MFFAIFRKFIGLYFIAHLSVYGQQTDNGVVIELGQTNFPIERPFVITVSIPNTETRPSISFPDIPNFDKKGTSASVTTTESGGKLVTNQIITQNYQARSPGRYRLAPFSIVVNGEQVESEGAELVVRPSISATAPLSNTTIGLSKNAAFLQVKPTQTSIYTGQGIGLRLSFFVADTYPFELNFTSLDKQVQTIVKQLRPVNAWEENWNITDLTPIPVLIGGKKYREFRLYQAMFFPLAARPITIPALSLQLSRRPVIGPPTAQPELVTFTSRPVVVVVQPLPPHPLRGRVPVGLFRLEEGLNRLRVGAGQSVRYNFTVVGEGNITTLPAPTIGEDQADMDVFPPEARQVIDRTDDRITGRKMFSYFLVPHQNGTFPLANRLQWVYFDPQRSRYDTLQPRLHLTVGGRQAVASATDTALGDLPDNTSVGQAGQSLYAGIERVDSTEQPIQIPQLIRALANVLIVLMLLGVIFVIFRK